MAEEKENKGGSPPFYKDVDELDAKINEYFNEGIKKRTVLIGKSPNQEKVEIPIPTISGLTYYLGFESRQSFYDYEKREGFSYTIKRARLFIEVEYEEQLSCGNTVGAIFALKNMGWKDKTHTDVTTDGEKLQSPPISVVVDNKSIKLK